MAASNGLSVSQKCYYNHDFAERESLRGFITRGSMSYYRYHVFFCTNQREDGAACCQQSGAQAMRDYAKERVKALGIAGKGKVRINKAGCMDRCNEGPVIAVYPEGVWYTYIDHEDIDEIIEKHLVNGEVVKRLLLRQK